MLTWVCSQVAVVAFEEKKLFGPKWSHQKIELVLLDSAAAVPYWAIAVVAVRQWLGP